MADKVLDFSLGPGGKFYFLWRDGNESKMGKYLSNICNVLVSPSVEL